MKEIMTEELKPIEVGIMDYVDDRRTMLKTLLYGGEFVLIVGWIFLILKVGWDKMEMWTYLIGLPILLFSNLFFAIKGHSTNLSQYKKKNEHFHTFCRKSKS